MDEAREEREELEALEREVEDLRREQEAEERFWTCGAA
jgi:hypothetical protein